MGTISSGTGLISGMDISGIVAQLMQIESRPLTALQTRITDTQAIQAAYQDISAKLLASNTVINRLWQRSTFQSRAATSSQPTILSATVSNSAPVGNYSFLVRSVVSTHQMASLGYVDHDRTPVGAGTMSFEPVQARVDSSTELSALNGGEGVRRGQIRITDRSGATAEIDLRSVVTVDDVLETINDQSKANVRAFIDGDRLVIEDQTGLTTGTLSVSEVGGGSVAADLGIAGSESGTGKITSVQDLLRLTASSRLATLNDQLGVRYLEGEADLQFTLANGRTFEVDLTNQFGLDTNLAELNGGKGVGEGTIRITNKAGITRELTFTGTESINDIKAKLASAENSDLNVQVSAVDGTGLITIKDSSGGTGKLKIEDVTGTIAAQLKLVGETATGETSISGRANYQYSTINSVIRKIQFARDSGGQLNNGAFELTVSADGKSLSLVDHTTGGSIASAASLNGSSALKDLGLDGVFQSGVLGGRRVASSINTVQLSTLNGGEGTRLGITTFQLRDGTTRVVDFTGAQTLQDVINRINGQSSLRAEVSSGGTGIEITDGTVGTGTFSASGATATDLHFAGTSTDNRLQGGDLNRKYVSENTLLSTLNGGKGIGLTAGDAKSIVSFQVTNSAGKSLQVNLEGSTHQTVGDVIDKINSAVGTLGVSARVNSNGDGIELYESPLPDTGKLAGSGKLTVTEVGNGTAASALHIKGEATVDNPGVLTGSFAGTVDISSSDTLDDLIDKINKAGLNVRASLINDGSSDAPYRLVLTSSTSGTAGRIAYSDSGTGLSLQTTAEARDARVVVGDMNSPNAIVINSSSNTITGVAPGVTLNLLSAGDTPVEVSIAQNSDNLVADLKSFIEGYNGLLDQIDELTKYDAETNTKGILLGDSTILQVRDVMYREVSRSLSGDYSMKRLTNVGFSYGTGGRLEFDEQEFREAMAADPVGVEDLFAKRSTTKDANGKDIVQYVGIAAHLSQAIKELSIGSDSLLSGQKDRLDSQVELYNKRAENMQKLLDLKQDQYYKKFQAMEAALANMQSQQTAITQLSSLASSMSSA